MKLLKFTQYISENRDIEGAEASAAELGKTAAKINRLIDLGLVDESGYKEEFNKIITAYQQLVKGLKLNPREQEDLAILSNLNSLSGINTFAGLETDGAKALFAKGLHMVSTPRQLMNGTLVFSLDPEYHRKNGWGIGFFPGPKVIKRMTPKGIDLGVYGRRQGSMDIRIKDFSNTTSSVLDFFNTAMLWAAEKIDFEHATLYPEPSAWKYNVRRKNSPANRTEADDLIVQSNELKNQAIPLWRTDKLEYLELMLKSFELKLKAAELTNNASWQVDINYRINQINNEIKKLQQ